MEIMCRDLMFFLSFDKKKQQNASEFHAILLNAASKQGLAKRIKLSPPFKRPSALFFFRH